MQVRLYYCRNCKARLRADIYLRYKQF